MTDTTTPTPETVSVASDGGPAFPVPADRVVDMANGHGFASMWGMGPQPGMTLRQWYAGLYMAGQAVNHVLCFTAEAKFACLAADALIAELAKGSKP